MRSGKEQGSGHWSMVCTKGHRYSWDGSASPVPPCPKCKEEAQEEAARSLDEQIEEAMAIVDDIQAMADDVPERGEEFAESVRDKAIDIGDTIEQTGVVTEGQMKALENMRDGLERWLE